MMADDVHRYIEEAVQQERRHCEARFTQMFGDSDIRDRGRWFYLLRYVRLIAKSEYTTPYDLLWNLVQQHTRHDQEAVEDKTERELASETIHWPRIDVTFGWRGTPANGDPDAGGE